MQVVVQEGGGSLFVTRRISLEQRGLLAFFKLCYSLDYSGKKMKEKESFSEGLNVFFKLCLLK